jgi:prepilin peptidase CpaA
MPSNPLYILLPPLFAISGYTEIKSRRIPNWLTYSAAICALAGSLVTGGPDVFIRSLLGAVFGLAIFFPFCVAGAVGGGDLKLMTAVGAVVGSSMVWWVLYYTVVAGGVMALLILIWSRQFIDGVRRTMKLLVGVRAEARPEGLRKRLTVPYGIAIAIGTVCAVYFRGANW